MTPTNGHVRAVCTKCNGSGADLTLKALLHRGWVFVVGGILCPKCNSAIPIHDRNNHVGNRN